MEVVYEENTKRKLVEGHSLLGDMNSKSRKECISRPISRCARISTHCSLSLSFGKPGAN